MYKLVVVDDETTIRKGMCNYIDWNEMGFQVAADFEDGKETIEYISGHAVDVVLTDIEMAQVSGLELAKYIYENKLPIKVVIISGYKEFEYARKAVEYNVEYYLLKPVRMNEVHDVFNKIRDDIEQNKAKEESSMSKQKDFEELIPALQEQFWISLLVGCIKGREIIIKKSKLLRLDLDMNSPCAILDVQITRDENSNLYYFEQQENKHNLINNIFEGESEGIRVFPIHFSSDILKLVAIADGTQDKVVFKEKLKAQIEEKSLSVLKLLKLKFIIRVEKIFDNIIELAEFKSTLQMHVQEQETREVKLVPADYERLMQKYKLLIAIINDGDFEELDSLLDNIFFEFRSISIDQVKQLLIDMFSMISNKFMKMGSDLWIHLNEKVNYQQFLEVNTSQELKLRCKDMLRATINLVNNKQNDASKNVVDQAISYMKENYDKELSLENIADRYFLNPTYFSRLFKQYTGTTFTDYLIELRIGKARELLLLGKYKVYEVSQKVGYKSEKYFFRVFKQYTGSSPVEYYKNKVLTHEK